MLKSTQLFWLLILSVGLTLFATVAYADETCRWEPIPLLTHAPKVVPRATIVQPKYVLVPGPIIPRPAAPKHRTHKSFPTIDNGFIYLCESGDQIAAIPPGGGGFEALPVLPLPADDVPPPLPGLAPIVDLSFYPVPEVPAAPNYSPSDEGGGYGYIIPAPVVLGGPGFAYYGGSTAPVPELPSWAYILGGVVLFFARQWRHHAQ